MEKVKLSDEEVVQLALVLSQIDLESFAKVIKVITSTETKRKMSQVKEVKNDITETLNKAKEGFSVLNKFVERFSKR